MSWVDERSKRIAAENSHPEISLSDTGEKETAYAKSGNYVDINISVRTIHGVVHHALPFLTRICLLENEKCSASYDFENKVQIFYHKGTKSFEPQTIDDTGDKIVPFYVVPNGKSFKLLVGFDPGTDNTCSFCNSVANGKYRVDILIISDESTKKETHILDLYGNPETLSFRRES